MFILENFHLIAATVIFGFFLYILFSIAGYIRDIRRRGKAVDKLPMRPKHWLWGHSKYHPGPNEAGLAFNRESTLKFPKIMGMWLGLYIRPSVLVHHPDTVKAILKISEPKPKGYSFGSPWIGDGLLLSSGNKWQRNRKLITPAFHFDVLKKYTKIQNQAAELFITKLKTSSEEGKSFDFFSNSLLLTLDIILRCSFSYESDIQVKGESHPYVQAVLELADLWIKRTMNPFLFFDFFYRLTEDYKKFHRHCQYVHSISEKIISRRRKNFEANNKKPDHSARPSKDFLDILLKAKDETGAGLTDLEIREEVDTFLFAGHDTTASAISWALYSLAQNPNYQMKCQQEIDSIMAEKNNTDYIAWEDLSRLTYLTRCIKESLRMHCPIPFIARRLTKPLTIEGVTLPVNSIVEVGLYNLHHNPSIWENPMQYDPDRFLPENIDKKDSFAFLPFSAGPRNCIGQQFAMNEIKVVLARILHKFIIRPDPSFEVKHKWSLVMKTEEGMYLKVEPRY